ncbi:MAG: response regulator [Thainema sp.]
MKYSTDLRQLRKEWQPRNRVVSLLLISGTILAVGATAFTSYWFVRNLILDTLKNHALSKVEKAGDEVDVWLSGRLGEVAAMAETYEIRSMDWDIAEPYLQLEQDRLSDFWMFILVNPDGTYYTTRTGFAEGQNLTDRAYFQMAMQGKAQASDMIISRTTGKRQINISVPVWSFPPANYDQLPEDRVDIRRESLQRLGLPDDPNAEPEVIGNFAGNIPVTHVTNVVNRTQLGEGSYAFALDSNGVPIAHPNEEFLQGLDSFLDSDNPALAQTAASMVAQKSGVELMEIDGQWVYVAYSPSEQSNWSLALVIPRQNLEHELHALNLLALVIGCLLLIATITALRQVQMLDQTRDRANEEALLNRMTRRIRKSLDLDTILQTTVEEVANLLKLDRVAFAWLDLHNNQFVKVCDYVSTNQPRLTREQEAALFESLAQHTKPGESLRFAKVTNLQDWTAEARQAVEQAGIQSCFALPVRLGTSKRIGYLICTQSKARRWDEREAKLLTAVTDQMAIAINQASLYLRTQEQVEIVSTQAEQLKEASAQIRDTLAYLTTIINNLVDGLLVTDAAGTITQANPAFAEMFGLDAHQIINQPCQQVLDSDLADLIYKTQQFPDEVFTAELSLIGGRTGQAIATAIHKHADQPTSPDNPPILSDPTINHQPINHQLLASNSTINPEPRLGTVILIRDITAEKEVDQMKTDFISTVSHELRTPLTSVLGFAKIIKKKLDDVVFPLVDSDDKRVNRTVRQVKDNIDIILTEGTRLTTLINDVLDIAKMEAGKVEWKMESLSIAEVIARAIAATSALFEAKQLRLVREIELDLPPIMGDRDRLIQVVINLLSNAVKFTDEGTVTCRAVCIEQDIVVSVIDTGSGIAPENCDKVFEKFKQVGDTLTDKPKGTGLGLPICAQIVEHHQGRIWVESELGKGSTFRFTLPVQSETRDYVQRIDLDSLLKQLSPAQNLASIPVIDSTAKTILIVDDEAHIRELLRQHLEAEGYHIEEAEDGREAIGRVKQVGPDLIILDVMMPDVNGFDVAAVIKNDPLTMGIPIMILSILEHQERGQQIGVDRYLTKPINTEELLQAVRELISQGGSKRRVLVVDEDALTVQTLVDVLKTKGFTVAEASNETELMEKVLAAQPEMVIANANFWERSDAVKTLKLKKGLEHISFLLIADHDTHDATEPETTTP